MEKPIIIKVVVSTVLITAFVAGTIGYVIGNANTPVPTPSSSPTASPLSIATPVATVSSSATPTPTPTPEVAFSIYGQIHWGEELFMNDKDFLLVDVKFVNQTGAQSYIDVNDFRLKDVNGASHPLYFNSEISSQPRFQDGVENLPHGRVELRSQMIEPAETLNAAIIFYVPKATKSFDLVYKSKTYRLTI